MHRINNHFFSSAYHSFVRAEQAKRRACFLSNIAHVPGERISLDCADCIFFTRIIAIHYDCYCYYLLRYIQLSCSWPFVYGASRCTLQSPLQPTPFMVPGVRASSFRTAKLDISNLSARLIKTIACRRKGEKGGRKPYLYIFELSHPPFSIQLWRLLLDEEVGDDGENKISAIVPTSSLSSHGRRIICSNLITIGRSIRAKIYRFHWTCTLGFYETVSHRQRIENSFSKSEAQFACRKRPNASQFADTIK